MPKPRGEMQSGAWHRDLVPHCQRRAPLGAQGPASTQVGIGGAVWVAEGNSPPPPMVQELSQGERRGLARLGQMSLSFQVWANSVVTTELLCPPPCSTRFRKWPEQKGGGLRGHLHWATQESLGRESERKDRLPRSPGVGRG